VNESSLRVGLLSRLGLVLVLLLALDAVACYFTSLYFANLVYDRWLIDSTRSLAQAVGSEHGRIEFDLPLVALQIFQFDEVDKTYFRISSDKRGFIAGETSVRGAPHVPINGIQLTKSTVARQAVREVTTRIAPPETDDTVTVTVAETLIKRQTLVRDILLAMVAPQVALLSIALVLAWFGISRGLKPLTDLASQIEARDVNNLTPVPQTGLPREARVLAARINELLARLSNAMRAQKRFVADAAHQLRTPLAAIMLQTERARRAADGTSEKEALNALHRSVERAARMSQQLLALARTEPEAMTAVDLKPLDLVGLARRIGEESISRALERDIDFGLIVPEQEVSIVGDERLLGELLSNLIDNALRYSNASGSVSVIVEPGSSPRLCVQDDGPGIPEEERTKIFERFYRVSGSNGDGCGLGLAIVEEIARLHGASVEVTSAIDDRGSRFTVTFNDAQQQR
jgi:two-component system, OmpR family, sensor histidine kinase TctE